MNEIKTCAHTPCTCVVKKDATFAPYCSEHCKSAADLTELRCGCGCPGSVCK